MAQDMKLKAKLLQGWEECECEVGVSLADYIIPLIDCAGLNFSQGENDCKWQSRQIQLD